MASLLFICLFNYYWLAMPRPHPVPSRKPGRPLAATADHRERLLDAALAHFVAHGIASATLRGIAKQGGVTPALVSYYFGSKEKLVATVIEERVLPVFAEATAILASTTAKGLVTGFVKGMRGIVERHPWLPALWVREILTSGGALREMMLEHFAPQLPRKLAARFAEMQRAGALNPELDPRLLVVSMIGLTLFTYAAQPVWSQIYAAGDVGPQQMQCHTLALLERGLEMTHEP